MIAVLITPGCGTGMAGQKTVSAAPMTRERLAARVDDFWKAWQEQDLHRIFLLYAPSYRNRTSEPAFYEVTRGMLGINPLEYTIAKVEMTDGGRKATVTVDSFAVIPPMGRVPSKLELHWVYEEGDWYKVMDPVSFPEGPPQSPALPPPPTPALPPVTPGPPSGRNGSGEVASEAACFELEEIRPTGSVRNPLSLVVTPVPA